MSEYEVSSMTLEQFNEMKESYFGKTGVSIRIMKSHKEIRDGQEITIIDEFEIIKADIA